MSIRTTYGVMALVSGRGVRSEILLEKSKTNKNQYRAGNVV